MEPKALIAKSRTVAKRVASKSVHTAKRTAVSTGAAGPLYRAANKAVVVGDRGVARVRRSGERRLGERGYAVETKGRPRLRRLSEAERFPDSLPDELPRLPADQAEAFVSLPPRINWSDPHRIFDLGDRGDRAVAYALLLEAGTRADIEDHVDGPRLAELWDDLAIAPETRARFQPLVDQVR